MKKNSLFLKIMLSPFLKNNNSFLFSPFPKNNNFQTFHFKKSLHQNGPIIH